MGTVSPGPSVQPQPVKYEQEHGKEHYDHQSFPAEHEPEHEHEDQVADAQVESHTVDSGDVDPAHVENDVADNVEEADYAHEHDEQSLNGAADDSAVVADRQFSPEVSDDRATSEQ